MGAHQILAVWTFVVIFVLGSVFVVGERALSPNNSGILSVKRCCPPDQNWDHDLGCQPAANASQFTPLNITFSNGSVSLSDVEWETYKLECSPGYVAKNYSLNDINFMLSSKDGIVFEFRDLLNFKTTEYCLSLSNRSYSGFTCRPNTTSVCADATCVQKCCGEGEVFSFQTYTCSPHPQGNQTLKFQSVSGYEVSPPADLQVLHLFPECQSVTKKDPQEDQNDQPVTKMDPQENPNEQFYLLREGVLFQPASKTTFAENEFCIDLEVSVENTDPVPFAFVCTEHGLPEGPTTQFYIYSIGVLISSVFLLATILLHLFIPKLRDMQGYCLLSHVSSLFVADLALLVGYLFSGHIHQQHCVINAFILQFSLLAAFFWLNIMCYDIWRVLRATIHVIPLSGILANDKKRFRIYCVYAWGGPLVITLVTLILHYVHIPSDIRVLTPGFGVIRCWFQGDLERLAFFYGPVGVLFAINLFLLGHTAMMLRKAGQVLIESTCNRGHLDAFWQRFKLFSLMAICWVTEILSWQIKPEEIWYLTDFLNTLQGFFVFVIFICSKKKHELVKEFVYSSCRRVSDAARKLSRTDETGADTAMWHTTKSTSSTYGSQNSQFPKEVAQEQIEQKGTNP